MLHKYFNAWLGLLLASSCFGQLSRSEVEEQFRIGILSTNDNIKVDVPNRQPPLGVRLLALAKQAGFSRQDSQQILLKLVDDGLRASNGQDALRDRRVANGALSALGDIADATVLDRIVHIAETAPPRLVSDAVRAATKTASRENLLELPAITRRLLKSPAQDSVYGLLHAILQFDLPSDPAGRDQRIQMIVGLFKEGLRNPDNEDWIYLDKTIEQYDQAFRHSDERHRILRELSGSSNPIVKRYAEAKLQEYFTTSDSAAPAPIIGEIKKQELSAVTVAASVTPSSHTSEVPAPSGSRMNTLFVMVSAAVVGGLLVFLVWRRS